MPERLLITNEEAPLTEEQVKKHFASIDEQSAAIVASPNDVTKRFARSLDFYLVQDFDNAIEDLNQAVMCESKFFPAYFNRALIRFKQLEYQKVAKEYNDKNAEEQKTKTGDYEMVKRDLDKVIELAPDFVYAYYNRGNVLSSLKDYRAAIVDYDKAIELDSKFAEAYYNRGLTHIYLGNNRQGIQDLSKAGELGLFSAYNIIKRFTERKRITFFFAKKRGSQKRIRYFCILKEELNVIIMIKITFPDGSVREYNEGVTGLQIAESISSRLAQDVLACGVNGETIDLSRPINEDANFVLYKWEDEQGKHAFWHTSAHLLAEALQELYPGIQFGIGPAIENGFYYDVDSGEATIKDSDLPVIEAKMAELAAKKETLVRESIAKEDALKKFGERGETYKCELISELEDGHITTYTQGAFTDLCRGPHLMTTAPIKAIKLLSVAGAYWRGQEDRKQMTRIYGITFPKKKMLDEYLAVLEEAKKRDHRKIGKEMDLFMFTDMVGKGLPMWLPKGTALRIRLQDFLRRIQARYDYQEVMCPPIGNKNLYITSGHYAKYGKDSFQPIHTPEEGEEYFLKPMNCPHHCMIYKNSPRSYKDLPLRIAEFGTVCRYEQSGELHGLTRVRSFLHKMMLTCSAVPTR